MKLTIRRKILLAFAVLPVVLVVSGFWMLKDVDLLGRSIDVIMRENYRSVICCQKANEALERIDSGLLYALSGKMPPEENFKAQVEIVNREWAAELANLTVDSEKEKAERVKEGLARYLVLFSKFIDARLSTKERTAMYEREIYPLFVDLKTRIGEILVLNQDRMHEANESARLKAEGLFRRGLGQFVICLLFLAAFGGLLTRWIQNPVRRLIDMSREIADGNLALAVDAKSDDEIGQLSRSFNAMANSLRTTREDLQERLARGERVFKELPLPIAVFDLAARTIRLSSSTASAVFGWAEGRKADDFGEPWLQRLFAGVRRTGRACSDDELIDRMIGGRRCLFRPTAIPLPVGVPVGQMTEVVVILKDARNEIRRQDLKREAIAAFSDQLRRPLADLSMSLYLLIEEKCGPLQPEQMDFLLAMQKDGQELERVISGVLDFQTLNGGKDWQFVPCRPLDLLREAQGRFAAVARMREQVVEVDCASDVPTVGAVPGRIASALDNLLDNAVRFSPVGGTIALSAAAHPDAVEFSVRDSGPGISPENAGRVFDPFFRGEESDSDRHVGLGLSIVREIITAHHGSVGVRSGEKGGAIVYFTLPC